MFLPIFIVVLFLASVVGLLSWWAFLLYKSTTRWKQLPGGGMILQSDHPFPDADLRAGITIFMATFEEKFGPNLEVHEYIWSTRIEWREGNDFPLNDQFGRRAYGWNPSGNHIHVAVRDGGNLANTALFHELVHVVLRATNGSPDPDHEGDRFPGWTPEHTALERESKAAFTAWWLENTGASLVDSAAPAASEGVCASCG